MSTRNFLYFPYPLVWVAACHQCLKMFSDRYLPSTSMGMTETIS